MKPLVLNRSDGTAISPNSKEIAQQLKSRMDHLKLNFYDLEKGGVDYDGMKDAEAFRDYKAATRGLSSFDPDILTTREAKLAFWINIYNALVVHGILELNIRKSVKEVSSFFEAASYNVGDYTLSLDDIEHGILRANQKKHLLSLKPFGSGDPRRRLVVEKVDPRIHFALVCGSNSCPPIDVYEEKEIDEQLDLVTTGFINSDEVRIEKAAGTLKLSRIFKWYKDDFGSREDLLAFIIRYRYDPEEKAFLRTLAGELHISYMDYDWSLNLV